MAERFQIAIDLLQIKLHFHRIAALKRGNDLGHGIFHQGIVGIEEQHELAPRSRPPCVVGRPLSRIGLEDRADAPAVCRYDPTRAVCRAIVHDDYFQRLIGLFKSTVDGSGDKFLIVAIDDYNRRQRAPSMHGVRAHWYHPQDTF
jgi:hypothetical protein